MPTEITHPAVDVLVLGMGHVGGPVAAELSLAGFKVVGLEKGPYWDYATDWVPSNIHDELGISINRKFDTPHAYWTCTIRNNRNQFANPVRRYTMPIQYHTLGHGVGGAGAHWGGGVGRFGPWPFDAYSSTTSRYGNILPSNHDMEDWPITYNDAMPYYVAWERAIGVSGTTQAPFLPGFDNYKFPEPPHPTTPTGKLFRDTALSMGLHPYDNVTALSSVSYVNQYGVTRNACVHCGYCGGACNYVCEVGAKASSHVTTVPAALKTGNFDLRTHSWVFRIDTDSTGKTATAVRYYDASGNVHIQPAKAVFNALWGYNIARLMFLSGIGKPYNPVTVSGSLGRGLQNGYAPSTTSIRGTVNIGANAYSAGSAGGGGFQVDDYADDNFDHKPYFTSAGFTFIGGTQFSTGGYQGSGPGLFTLAMPASATNWGSKWKAGVKDVKLPTKLTVGLGGAGPEIPNTDWFIDLDPHYTDFFGDPVPRVTLDWGANRYRVPTALAPRAEEVLTKMGATNVTTTKVPELSQNVDWWGHHMRGGSRMGKNPATSVWNKWLQSWDVQNLFSAGENAIPFNDNTSAGTHVAGMLSYLAADGIKKYLAAPGPLV